MYHQEVWMDVKQLHQQGASIREIARRTGLSRATVRRILTHPVPKRYGPRPPRPRKLDPHVEYLTVALGSRPWVRASILYEEIRARGYVGHYEAVKCWVRPARRELAARRRACVRFETAPGVEAQADWAGPFRGLLAAPVWIFRLQLAWSRWCVSLPVLGLDLGWTLAAFVRALERLGGVPQRVVVDNPKTLVVRPRPRLQLAEAFLDLCRHYGWEPSPAWPYHPERKGKIERSFLDLERSGFLEQPYRDLAALTAALAEHDQKRGERLHTTIGKSPVERFREELPQLRELPPVAFDPRLPETRRVLSDCTVSFRAAAYSVPWRLVGRRVTVKVDPWTETVAIYAGAEPVASHPLLPKGQRSVAEEHVAELRRPRMERLRGRAAAARTAPAQPPVLSVVPWPFAEVPCRPIEEYAAALGGGR